MAVGGWQLCHFTSTVSHMIYDELDELSESDVT